MKKLYGMILALLAAAMILPACAPQPEEFVLQGTQIEGIVTVVSRERVEFVGRLTGEPDTAFWLFSQEEGVGEGNPNWTRMQCPVSTFDSAGTAYVSCSVEVDKKYRQNAIVLSTSDDPQLDKAERIEYRPNLIVGVDEEYQLLDYNYQQLGVEPTSVKNAMQIYYNLRLGMDTNADYNRYPPRSYYPVDEMFAPSRGFYLTFVTEKSCSGLFSESHVNLYSWDGTEWAFVESVRLEDVNFDYSSGEHDFNVEGYTVRLKYRSDYECEDQYYYVEIP